MDDITLVGKPAAAGRLSQTDASAGRFAPTIRSAAGSAIGGVHLAGKRLRSSAPKAAASLVVAPSPGFVCDKQHLPP